MLPLKFSLLDNPPLRRFAGALPLELVAEALACPWLAPLVRRRFGMAPVPPALATGKLRRAYKRDTATLSQVDFYTGRLERARLVQSAPWSRREGQRL